MGLNELQVFNNSEFGTVDILMIDDKAYFPATECAAILGYTKPHNAIERHCRYSLKRGVPHPQSANKTIEKIYIPEGDLYRLLARSNLPAAISFEKWVFDEVLPSIRKHGMYATAPTIDQMLADPGAFIQILTAYKEEQDAHKHDAALLDAKTIQLDENRRWYSIKRVARLNGKPWKSFDWRRLKTASDYLGYDVRKIFDANYGDVNVYHLDVWRQEYPECTYLTGGDRIE